MRRPVVDVSALIETPRTARFGCGLLGRVHDRRIGNGGALPRAHLPRYQLFYVAVIPLLFSAAFADGLGRMAQGYRSGGVVVAVQVR